MTEKEKFELAFEEFVNENGIDFCEEDEIPEEEAAEIVAYDLSNNTEEVITNDQAKKQG